MPLREVLRELARFSSRIGTNPIFGRNRLLTPPSSLVFASRSARFHAVKSDTNERNVRWDLGHVNFETTPEEQEEHGLEACYGFSPLATREARRDREKRWVHHGMQDGRPYSVNSIVQKALDFSKDPLRPHGARSIVADIGPLTAYEAWAIKEFAKKMKKEGHKFSTVPGDHGMNCVSGMWNLVVYLYGEPSVEFNRDWRPEDVIPILEKQIEIGRQREKANDFGH